MDSVSEYFPFWEQLQEADRKAVERAARRLTLLPYERASGEGGACIGLLAVRSGRLRVYTVTETGKELTLYRLFDGDLCLLSASCMFRSLQFSVRVEAEEETSLFVIPTDVFRPIAERSAPAANFINELMASRFSEVMWKVEDILGKKMDSRLAGLLLEEAALSDGKTVTLTHERLAAHLGSAREVVTRLLKYLQDEGMVRLSRGKIEISDEARLNELAQETA